MTLIVEDGSIVAGADSYVTRAAAITYAANRGVALPNDSTADEVVRKAADWMESYRTNFIGTLVERDQPLAWPREDVVIEGFAWSGYEIPRQVINCQLAAIVEIANGNDPFNPPSNLPVIAEEVAGAVKLAYANPGSGIKVTKNRDYMAQLRLLLSSSGMTVIRA